MANCLRCGAGSEWIQGRVPKETTAEETSDLKRYRWLRDHAFFAGDSMRELWFDAKNHHHDGSSPEALDRAIDEAMTEHLPLPQRSRNG